MRIAVEQRSFSELEGEFLRIVAKTVFCTATTVGADGRPRNRMLHPIFVVSDGRPIGWALTGQTPLKTPPARPQPADVLLLDVWHSP